MMHSNLEHLDYFMTDSILLIYVHLLFVTTRTCILYMSKANNSCYGIHMTYDRVCFHLCIIVVDYSSDHGDSSHIAPKVLVFVLHRMF